MKQLRLGLPAGSLQKATFELFARAGYGVSIGSRSYNPDIDDDELSGVLIRAQEISRYVEQGVIDLGLTGQDWVRENESDVHVVAELVYAKRSMRPVRWVLAVPESSPVRCPEDLAGKHIATELVQVTRGYLAERGIDASVEFSWGATEAKAPELADAIVEVTETGSSLRANKLRIVDTVMESVTQLIANNDAWRDAWKRRKIENIALMLEGAICARGKVGLKLNVHSDDLEDVLGKLPALRRPTVSSLSEPGWHAIETIIDENVVRKIVPELKRAGAQGIIEYPLTKVIP